MVARHLGKGQSRKSVTVIASSLRKGNIVEVDGKLYVHEGVAVPIEPPHKAVLEVVEPEPSGKGPTAASSYKPAVLSNGVRTMVPPFVSPGTKIVVMTADGSYVERAKA